MKKVALAAVLCVAVAAGCQSAAPGPTAPGATPGVTPVVRSSAAPTDGVPVAGEISREIDHDFGPGTYDFPAPAAGLGSLSAYRGTLVITFEGTEAGVPVQWSTTHVMTTTLEPRARELIVSGTGAEVELPALHRAEVGGVAYEIQADGTCTADAVYEPDSLALRWEPASFLFGIRNGVEAGTETVNGVLTNHYEFDERAFGPLPPASSLGEMWVAADGGYIVRYAATTDRTAALFGEDSAGTLTMDYELTDINAPLATELPADCPSDIFELTVLPDATGVFRGNQLLTYATASSVEEAGAFYGTELSGQGWQPTTDAAELAAGTTQPFARGDSRLWLTITTDAGVTTVRFTVSPIQE